MEEAMKKHSKFVPATGGEVAAQMNREVRGLAVRKLVEFKAALRTQEREAHTLLDACEKLSAQGLAGSMDYRELLFRATAATEKAFGMRLGMVAMLRFAKLAKSRTAFAASLPTAFVRTPIFSRPWRREGR